MNKILVTGAAGFIGSRVCEMLLEKGEHVIGIDNMNEYYDVRLKKYRIDSLNKFKNFVFYRIDIESYEEVKSLFREHKFRSVFNLAARAGVRYSIENPWVYMRTNSEGTLNLLEAMKEFGVNKFILASTSSLYAGSPIPFSENLAVNTPISPYAASKKAAELLSYTYHKQYGIDVSVLRYFTVFGPGGRPDMMPYRFAKWIIEGNEITLFGDGNYSRDFTFIDDIALGTIQAEKSLGYEIINLGGGQKPIPIIQFIHWIEEYTNRKARIKYLPTNPTDMEFTMADITKAKSILNWYPQTTTFDGIKKLCDRVDLLRFNC